jgi:Ni/Co efflux regulator RcnB
MRTFRLTAVAAVAVFALSMPAFAGQAKPAAKPAKAKTMTVSGTLEKSRSGSDHQDREGRRRSDVRQRREDSPRRQDRGLERFKCGDRLARDCSLQGR